ncbi:hypothetical protein SUGI_0497560 [Cryptomeria japonica]|uniref:uncharacterized protein LOC131062434 n=1 Tax=Cryptomeria japonica TaxID=3369 RepID=UPI002408BD76|nr:uncharacterized protein LOC131062434 [Cryptomeria japonica]GLJ25954.1 hypothetical protein SUGI_0497560 [Cryptomeria japonica]
MGCKGKRRREKNYMKAHGGHAPLAPPPTAKDMEAIPTKLRRLLQLKNSTPKLLQGQGDGKHSQNKNSNSGDKKPKGKGNVKKNPVSVPDPEDKLAGEIKKLHAKIENQKSVLRKSEVQSETSKRKRKRGDEFRLLLECQNLMTPEKRKRDRKKKYLDAKKKKHKKAKSDDDTDFPQHEKIKFGEVVSAPPKLEFPKKATAEIKIRQDVSQERLRLQAIENYRQRKGWTSRPGSHAPPIEITGLLSEA